MSDLPMSATPSTSAPRPVEVPSNEAPPGPAFFFRGWRRREIHRALSSATALFGASTVLLISGFMPGGGLGFVLLLLPAFLVLAHRMWALGRVCAFWSESEGMLRYESASPKNDFEVPLSEIVRVDFDPQRRGGPLVLDLGSGAARVLDELGKAPSEALRRSLNERLGLRKACSDQP